jgi:ribonuclease HI
MKISESFPQQGDMNSHEECPNVICGPYVEDQDDVIPPFYITLNMHDKMLHNCMLDSGASHNLMPKIVMEKLGLDITRPYQDLYSFDAKKVKCMGVIKDMVVTLAQLPMKSVIMDIVVADVPANYGLLLSRSFAHKLGGSLQMDMSYAMVPIFGGEERRLYRENKMQYVVSDSKKEKNHPIYSIEENMGCCSLFLNSELQKEEIPVAPIKNQHKENAVWYMYFDGAYSKEGAGAGIVLIPPTGDPITISHKLEFDATNNVTEYEALVLGLEVAKKMGVLHISVFGDSELVVQQIRKKYKTQHPRMRSYRNHVWDLIDNLFDAFCITAIPREQNQQADALATAASTLRPPPLPKLKHEVEMRFRPSIPDNVRHWQVFEDDQQIKRFLEAVE